MPLIKVDGYKFEAAEGPNGLKCWPPESLGPTLEGYAKRVRLEGFDMDMAYRPYRKASQRRGRPKGGVVKQCKEGIDQRANTGKR